MNEPRQDETEHDAEARGAEAHDGKGTALALDARARELARLAGLPDPDPMTKHPALAELLVRVHGEVRREVQRALEARDRSLEEKERALTRDNLRSVIRLELQSLLAELELPRPNAQPSAEANGPAPGPAPAGSEGQSSPTPGRQRPTFVDPLTGAKLPDPMTRKEFCDFWPTSLSTLKRYLRAGKVKQVRLGVNSAIPGREFVRLRKEGWTGASSDPSTRKVRRRRPRCSGG